MVVMLPAVAVKLALAFPDTIVTDGGTLKALLLLESATETPPAGAAWLRATVHVAVPDELRVVGVQLKLLTVVVEVTVIEPPDPERFITWPLEDAPSGLVSPMAMTPVVAGPKVKLMVAMVPFCRTLVFIPLTRQVYEPLDPAHVTGFPATVAEAPATAPIEETDAAL